MKLIETSMDNIKQGEHYIYRNDKGFIQHFVCVDDLKQYNFNTCEYEYRPLHNMVWKVED